ncbi:MAG TPA: F0F1 ATP synthase subunit B [Thermoguttaceae bacterium]|nr:F0F1 ATP synthase subunit B [Thermoguttaceae bacterium]
MRRRRLLERRSPKIPMRGRFRLAPWEGWRRLTAVLGGILLLFWPVTVQAASDSPPTEGLNPLQSWKSDLALWTAVVFLVVLVVLWKYAWGPIVRALQQREQTIATEIAQAQQQHQQAQELLAQYQQKLAQSQAEVQQMLDEARRQAEQTGRQIVQQAHQQAEQDREKMLQEIQRAKQQALQELSAEAAALAVQLAGKILQAELRPERHRQLIRQTLAQWEAGVEAPSVRTGRPSTDLEEPRR